MIVNRGIPRAGESENDMYCRLEEEYEAREQAKKKLIEGFRALKSTIEALEDVTALCNRLSVFESKDRGRSVVKEIIAMAASWGLDEVAYKSDFLCDIVQHYEVSKQTLEVPAVASKGGAQ